MEANGVDDSLRANADPHSRGVEDNTANLNLYEFIDIIYGTNPPAGFAKVKEAIATIADNCDDDAKSSGSSSSDECEQPASLTCTVQSHPHRRLESFEQRLSMLHDQVYALGNQLTLLSGTVTEMQASLHRFESQTNHTLRTYGTFLQWVDRQLSRVMLHVHTKKRERYNQPLQER
jgi:hypothetical protein